MNTFTQISGIVKSGFNKRKGKFNKNETGETSGWKSSKKSNQKFRPKDKKGPNPPRKRNNKGGNSGGKTPKHKSSKGKSGKRTSPLCIPKPSRAILDFAQLVRLRPYDPETK